ncbi:protein of unknown function [Methylocella tundrae]|uniref:Uncharacterized protein n=1 Tax=Methylocella tundrae TaxID=227605 RepID=A0A4U8Z2Z2_METTU|nr:protein of unknown function [Methylocella tundrae]
MASSSSIRADCIFRTCAPEAPSKTCAESCLAAASSLASPLKSFDSRLMQAPDGLATMEVILYAQGKGVPLRQARSIVSFWRFSRLAVCAAMSSFVNRHSPLL